MMIKLAALMIPLLLILGGCVAKQSPEPDHRFTFSWPYSDNDGMKPRGGVTEGAPVTLDKSPSPGWLSVMEPGVTKYERDRRAILSMAGTYRVTFNFIETVPLRSDYKVDRPYQSWATEYIEVIEDTGDFISLQHILIMYFVDENGKTEGPVVAKHWRQDWTYEDTEILEFKGNNTWRKIKVPGTESRGKWSQAVFQVDDTPRYEALGEWTYAGNYPSWTSSGTWRPLPRREFSVRDDYNVLDSINRVVITPVGWVHEQENLKLVVDDNGNPSGNNPYLVKEIGVNRYENIKEFDSKAAVDYWNRTAPFWSDVRKSWTEVISNNSPLKLSSSYDDKKLYEYLFEYADNIEAGGQYDSAQGSEYAKEIINRYVIQSGAIPDSAVY